MVDYIRFTLFTCNRMAADDTVGDVLDDELRYSAVSNQIIFVRGLLFEVSR